MKRNISFLLALLMCCSLLFPGIQTTAMAQDVPENSAKIAAELLEIMENAADDALIHIAIDLVSPSDAEIKAHIAATSADTINTYIMAKRAAQREVISGMTTAFAENYLDDGDEITFRGNYSPSIWVKVPKFKIALLAALDEVKSIGFAGYDNVQWLPQAEQVDSDHISEYLLEKIESLPDGERIAVAIERKGLDEDMIRQQTCLECGVSEGIARILDEGFRTLDEYNASHPYADIYSEAKMNVLASLYGEYNRAFLAALLPDLSEDCLCYVSDHSPSIHAMLTKAEILHLTTSEQVKSLTVSKGVYTEEPIISAKLAARMETATDTQRIAVAISRKGIDREILLPLIAQESGLSPETIEKVNNSLATVEEAMTYKAARLAVEKRLYAEYNSAFLAECLPDLPSGCLSYVADTYSTIHASLTKAEILSLVDVDQVISMDYVGPEFEDEDPLKAFRDLPAPTSWKYEGIVYCIDNRIMNGVSATKFEPDSELTRGQLVTVLYRVNGEPEVAFTKAFSDVPSGKYYSAAVVWAAKHDIVNGFEDGTFRPDAPVTREQLVTILYRYTHYLGIEIAGDPEVLRTFPDAAQVSSYAEDAFGWAVAEKLVNGVDVQGESFLKPKNHATRAQIASILMRYLEATEIPEPIINDSGTVNLMSSVSAKLVDQPDRINSKSADAVADFSLSFFRAARNADSNTVLSPLSVLYALALLQNGAQGQTLQELEAATGMSTQQLNEALRAIMGNLQEAYGNSEISIANSIWVRNGFGVKQPFLQNNADYLDAAAYSTPMDDTSVKEMNDWISENTNGMIENLISEIPAETVLALINAIAFKGEWTHPYESVAPGIFHAADGTEQKVEMLRSLESVYLHDDKVQGFAKHFYSDRYAFAVILPNEGIALEDYLEDLDGAALRKLLSEASNASVMTTMPKFKAETTVKLPAPLAKLGIRSAFSPFTSNLSGISDTPLFVSDGIQKAVIDVNKDGVSAAAATALLVEATSAPDEPIATITVDRPYLYLIYDSMTNVPLFVGTNVSFAE